jgi:DNA-binding NarL/FixJ family response regulator
MKILLADDHPLFREGMRHVLMQLGSDTEVVEAGSCEEALARAAAHADLALVLLDLGLPGKNGFAALELMSQHHPLLPIVILSGSEDRGDMRRALDDGALGFVPKSATTSVMLSALKLVLSGGIYVPPALLDALAPGQPRNTGALTPRQLEVLKGVVAGKSNKTIAAELGLTVSTVKAHVTAAFKALNVVSRTQAVVAAERLGLGPFAQSS